MVKQNINVVEESEKLKITAEYPWVHTPLGITAHRSEAKRGS